MLAPYDVLLTTCNHIVPHVLRQSKTDSISRICDSVDKIQTKRAPARPCVSIKIGSEDQSDGRAVWAINRMAREREEL